MRNEIQGQNSWSVGRHRRGGSAVLVLLLVIALIVGTFTTTMARRESQKRRSWQKWIQVQMLESAIESVAEIDTAVDESVRLPIDQSTGLAIVVTKLTDVNGLQNFKAVLLDDKETRLTIQRGWPSHGTKEKGDS